MTYGEILENAAEEERCYYVYMWVVDIGGAEYPFYVGKGKGGRWKSKASRSKEFLRFIETYECKPVKVVERLTNEVALAMEEQFKVKLVEYGLPLIDGEDNKEERMRRHKEGIAAAKAKGVKFGRPEKDVECVLLEGETVRDACKRLGVSKTYWYEQKKKIDLPSAKSTSRSDGQTPKDGADTRIVSYVT